MLKNAMRKFKGSPYFTVINYITFGIIWITLSDQILLYFVRDMDHLTVLQTYKGWFFIVITAFYLYYLVHRNIKHSEENVREHENIIMRVPLPMVSVRDTGEIDMVNKTFSDLFGYTIEDIPHVTEWFLKAYPDKEYRGMVVKEWSEEFDDIHQNRPPTHIFEVTDIWGHRHTIEFFVLMQKIRSLVIMKDLSKEREREKERNEESKMKALGQMAGGIAHDFNNQLGGIIGYTELLSQSIERNSVEYDYLQSIISASETSAQLIQQLLTYARKTTLEMVELNLENEIEQVIGIAERTIPSNINFYSLLGASSHRLMGNPSQLKSLFLNLILNAKDAMATGGELSFLTKDHCQEREGILNGLTLKKGNYLVVEVKDRGSGMSRDVLERVFEPFFTTKSKAKGTGMGLAVAYSTVKSHGGSIEVKSQEGIGSLFRVYLPLGQ